MVGMTSNARWRFSLRTFLLVSVVLSLALSHALTSRRLWLAENEVKKLRIETGHLHVDEPTKIQTLAIPTTETLYWKWKVYLPPGRNYRIHFQTRAIPTWKLPEGKQLYILEGTGEPRTFSVAIRKDHLDRWSLRFVFAHTSGVSIPDEDVQWVTDGLIWSQAASASSTMNVCTQDADKPLELLRIRAWSPGSDQSAPTLPGLLVWLQPAEDQPEQSTAGAIR